MLVYDNFIGFNNLYHTLNFSFPKNLYISFCRTGMIIPILHMEKLLFKGGICPDQDHKASFI